ELGLVLPEDIAGVDADREHVVGARDDIDDAAVHDGLRFARVLRADAGAAEPRTPYTFELADVAAVDLRERGITLVVPITAVRRPRVSWRGHERVALPGG